MVGNILNSQALQEGGDLLGHYDIPHTPFTVFGLFQQFLPNTRTRSSTRSTSSATTWACNGSINKYLRVAFDSQAIKYYHSQFTLPAYGCAGADDAGRCAVRSAARHPRILPAPGVQILATNQYRTGASIQNARAGRCFGDCLVWRTGWRTAPENQ